MATLSIAGGGSVLLTEGGLDLLTEGGSDLLTESVALTDLTASLVYGSMTLKFNTIDFILLNVSAGAVPLGAQIVLTDPAWVGTVAAVTTSDVTLQGNSQTFLTVTGTNTNALPSDTAPFDLSDAPVAFTDEYLLEDGSGVYLLESGTDFAGASDGYLMEGALSYAYSGLNVRTQVNLTGPNTTLGHAIVQQPGLRPGNTFKLTSANQEISASSYQINQATLQWHGVPLVPEYQIEFGDTPQTLAQWTQITAPTQPALLTAPVVVPLGPVIFGNASASHIRQAVGAGLVTVATSTFSVSLPVGHTLTVQVLGAIDALAYGWDNYPGAGAVGQRRSVRATLSGGIYTGAWIELPAFWVGGSTVGYRIVNDVSSAAGIALAAGTYTLSLQTNATESNQIEVFSGWIQAAVTTV